MTGCGREGSGSGSVWVMSLERYERLAALRGDPVKGIASTAWATNLGEFDSKLLLRAAIAVFRELVLADWTTTRVDDRRPLDAVEAAEAWLAGGDETAAATAKEAGVACTAARNQYWGTDHRIPEAARGIARVPTAKDLEPIWDALVAVEQELLARVALASEYKKAPEQRRKMIAILKRELEPKAATGAPAPAGPVAYSASGNFAVGQQLTHVKFGDLVVAAAGDKWIDVTLPDGTTKRLAQKPK